MPFGARNPRPRRPARRGRGRPDHGGPGLSSGLRGHRTAVARDYQNARQLLQAMMRRVDKRPRKPADTLLAAFNQHRMAQAQRARILGMLLIPFDAGHGIPLRRAPDARLACEQAYGPADAPLRGLAARAAGLIGAYEWRRKGVEIPALGGDRIHPHYGVFAGARRIRGPGGTGAAAGRRHGLRHRRRHRRAVGRAGATRPGSCDRHRPGCAGAGLRPRKPGTPGPDESR